MRIAFASIIALAILILGLSGLTFYQSMTGMAVWKGGLEIELLSPLTYAQASNFYIKVRILNGTKPATVDEVYAELDGKKFRLDRVEDYYVGRYFVSSTEELESLKITAVIDGKEIERIYPLQKSYTFLPFSITLIIIIIGLLILLKIK